MEFKTEEDADYAVKIMNMVKLFGKPLRCNKASQDKRPQGVPGHTVWERRRVLEGSTRTTSEHALSTTRRALYSIQTAPHWAREAGSRGLPEDHGTRVWPPTPRG